MLWPGPDPRDRAAEHQLVANHVPLEHRRQGDLSLSARWAQVRIDKCLGGITMALCPSPALRRLPWAHFSLHRRARFSVQALDRQSGAPLNLWPSDRHADEVECIEYCFWLMLEE